MKPTSKLRFIERTIEVHGDPKPVRILQQWWAGNALVAFLARFGHAAYLANAKKGEWRDVPLEAE